MQKVMRIDVDAFKGSLVIIEGIPMTIGERWPDEPMRCTDCREPITGGDMIVEVDTSVETVTEQGDGPIEAVPTIAGYILEPCGHNCPPYWAQPGTPKLELDVSLR